MCLAIYDSPEALRDLLDVCTDVLARVIKEQLEIIPPFHGGYCCVYGIWAPGLIGRSQCDMAAILSPRVYAEMVLPFDQRIFQEYEYSVIHTHSSFLHVVDALLESEHPRAIQIALDGTFDGSSIRNIVPACKKILERKSLIIIGRISAADFEYMVENLPPHGLFVHAALDEPEFARWEHSAPSWWRA